MSASCRASSRYERASRGPPNAPSRRSSLSPMRSTVPRVATRLASAVTEPLPETEWPRRRLSRSSKRPRSCQSGARLPSRRVEPLSRALGASTNSGGIDAVEPQVRGECLRPVEAYPSLAVEPAAAMTHREPRDLDLLALSRGLDRETEVALRERRRRALAPCPRGGHRCGRRARSSRAARGSRRGRGARRRDRGPRLPTRPALRPAPLPALPRSASRPVTTRVPSATRKRPRAATSGIRSWDSAPGAALASSKRPVSSVSGVGSRTASTSIAVAGAPSSSVARSTDFQRACIASIFSSSNRRRRALPVTAWLSRTPVTGNSMRSSEPATLASSAPSTGRSARVQARFPSSGKSACAPMRSAPVILPQGVPTPSASTSCRTRPPRYASDRSRKSRGADSPTRTSTAPTVTASARMSTGSASEAGSSIGSPLGTTRTST